MRTLMCSALLVLASSIVGCDLVFESQDVVIRHDAAGDALDVLFVYHGLSAGYGREPAWPSGDDVVDDPQNGERIAKGVEAFKRIAAGEREAMIVDWPLYMSLDRSRADDEKKLSSPDADAAEKAEAAERVVLYELVTLVDHGAFADESGKLCGFQRFRVHPWTKFETLLNACCDRAASEDAQLHRSNKNAAGQALRVAKADAKTPWFWFERGVLHVDIPMSTAERAEWARDIAQDSERADPPTREGFTQGAGILHLLGEWIASAQSIELHETGLRIAMGTGDAPIHWKISCPDRPYDAALQKALQAEGVKLREDVKVADLIAAMK